MLLLGLAMVGPLFAQTGWANVTFTGGEVRDPGRNLPRALIVGTALVVTLYLLANLAYVATLPLAAIQQAPQNRVGTAMMQAIFGTSGALVIAAAIMISTFSCEQRPDSRWCARLLCDGARRTLLRRSARSTRVMFRPWP